MHVGPLCAFIFVSLGALLYNSTELNMLIVELSSGLQLLPGDLSQRQLYAQSQTQPGNKSTDLIHRQTVLNQWQLTASTHFVLPSTVT